MSLLNDEILVETVKLQHLLKEKKKKSHWEKFPTLSEPY